MLLPVDDGPDVLNRPPVLGWFDVMDGPKRPVDGLALLLVNKPVVLLPNRLEAFENNPLPLDAGVEFENKFEKRLLAAGLTSSLFSPYTVALLPFYSFFFTVTILRSTIYNYFRSVCSAVGSLLSFALVVASTVSLCYKVP